MKLESEAVQQVCHTTRVRFVEDLRAAPSKGKKDFHLQAAPFSAVFEDATSPFSEEAHLLPYPEARCLGVVVACRFCSLTKFV